MAPITLRLVLIKGTYRQGQTDDVEILCVASKSLSNGSHSIFGPNQKFRVKGVNLNNVSLPLSHTVTLTHCQFR